VGSSIKRPISVSNDYSPNDDVDADSTSTLMNNLRLIPCPVVTVVVVEHILTVTYALFTE
jgi:hypothetical protein